MLSIYTLVLLFTFFNSFKYLIKQSRYHNFMITIFYIFSVIVLIFRMLFYGTLLVFNDKLEAFLTWDKVYQMVQARQFAQEFDDIA